MSEEIAQAPVDALNNEAGDGATTEELNNGEGKDFQALYENQKIRAEKAEAALKAQPKDQTGYDPEAIRKEAEEAAMRTYDKQFIDEKGYPDEIKAAIEKVAAVQDVSLRQASQDGYIATLVAEHERAEKVRAASPDTSGGGNASYTFDPANAPDVDVSTQEGQEAIEQWEKQLERHHRNK